MDNSSGSVPPSRRAETWQQWNCDSSKWSLLNLQPSIIPCQLQQQWHWWHCLKTCDLPDPHYEALDQQVWVLRAYPALCPHCQQKESREQWQSGGKLVFCYLCGSCIQPEQTGQTEDGDGGENAALSGGIVREDFLWCVFLVTKVEDPNVHGDSIMRHTAAPLMIYGKC